MEDNQIDPIVIISDDDDDDDDVVLVKEVKANESMKQEDDVIFVSEKPSTRELKRKAENRKNKNNKDTTLLNSDGADLAIELNIPHVGYFQTAFSSFNLIDDILRPLGVSHPVVLDAETVPAVIKHNVAHMIQSQTSCGSNIVPEQEKIIQDKPVDDIEISSVKFVNDLDLISSKSVDDSEFVKTSAELGRFSQLKLSKAEDKSALPHDVTTEPNMIDMEQNCFKLCLTESNKATPRAGHFFDTSSNSDLICIDKSSSLDDRLNANVNFLGVNSNQNHQLWKSAVTTSISSTTYTHILDTNSTCLNRAEGFASEALTSPSVSCDFVTTIASFLCSSASNVNVNLAKPQGLLTSPAYLSGTEPIPGTSQEYSSLCNSNGSESDLNITDLCISKKTSISNHSSLSSASSDCSKPTAGNLSGMPYVMSAIDNSQKQNDHLTSDKGLYETNSSAQGIQTLMPSSTVPESLFTKVSQGYGNGTNFDHLTQNSRILLKSNSFPGDSIISTAYKSSTSATISSQRKNHIKATLDRLSKVKNDYYNNIPCITDTDVTSSSHSKSFSVTHVPLSVKAADLSKKKFRAKQSLMWYNLVQARKHRLNHSKRGFNSLMRTHSNSVSLSFVSDRSNSNVGAETESFQWQIVSSEQTKKKRKGHISLFPASKRKRQILDKSVREKQSLKVKFKRCLSSGSTVSDAALPVQEPPYNRGLKKSIIRRQSILIGENSTCGAQANISTKSIGSENDEKELMSEKKYVQECITCDITLSSEKLSKCGRGHGICATCLESQVKVILTGEVEQKYIRCPARFCKEIVHFDELKRTLPSFVVEILEEKLDKEYMKYITKWMFTDEQLKSRSEFATLDTGIAPCPELNVKKLDETHSHQSRCMAEDLPTFWTPMESGAPVMAFEVVPDTEEYRSLAFQFYETLSFGDYDIVKIIRIQNPILWKYFSLKQSEMKQDNDGVNVEEKQLYHGTHRSTLEAIARKGFDWRLSGKHGTAYGCGSYFASSASYSHSYTDRAGSGLSVKSGGGHHNTLHSSLFLNYQRMRCTAPLLNRWYQTPQPSPAHCHNAVLPPAYGQTSSLNHVSNQTTINNTAGLTSATTSNLSSEKILPNTSVTSVSPALSSLMYRNCGQRRATHIFNMRHLYNAQHIPPDIQQFVLSSKNSYACTSLSSSTIGHLPHVSIPAYPEGYSNSSNQSSIISKTKSLEENKPNSSNTPTILQGSAQGTSDLTATFARDSSSKTHFMFMAKVLVGRHTVGKSGLKRPPPLDENKPYGRCYDSCVDHISYPQLYVIFDSNQAYPEYIVEYNWHKG